MRRAQETGFGAAVRRRSSRPQYGTIDAGGAPSGAFWRILGPMNTHKTLGLLLTFTLACGGGGSSSPPPDPGELGQVAGLSDVWSAKPVSFPKDLVVAPWGDVVLLSSDGVMVLAREDGRVLHTVKGCWPEKRSARFIDEHTLQYACSTEPRGEQVTFPSGALAAIDKPAVPPNDPEAAGVDAFSLDDTARYRELLVTASGDGIQVWGGNGAELKQVASSNMSLVTADAHGICGASTFGNVACWADGEVPKSTYVPDAPKVSAGTATAGNPAAVTQGGGTQEHLGTLSSARGSTLVLTTSGGATPVVASTGTLAKQVNTKLGSMTLNAWVNIAEVKVTSVSGDKVTCSVTRELTDVTVNGGKLDLFTPGVNTKLLWK